MCVPPIPTMQQQLHEATIPWARTPHSFIWSHFYSLHSEGTCGLKGHFNLITLEPKCYRAAIDQYRSGLSALIVQRREGPYKRVTWSVQVHVVHTVVRLRWFSKGSWTVTWLKRQVSHLSCSCIYRRKKKKKHLSNLTQITNASWWNKWLLQSLSWWQNLPIDVEVGGGTHA